MTTRPLRRNPTPALATLALLATTFALAGCAADEASTGIAIDFAGEKADLEGTVALDDDGVMTAHEQLVAWSEDSGVAVAIRSFSFGHCLDSIDGLPTTPGCSPGAEAYWALSVDGVIAEAGMDDVDLRAGSRVTWTYTPLETGNGSSDASAASAGLDQDPLGVTIDAPAPTTGDRVRLSGSVDQPARVSIDGGPAIDAGSGRWELESQPLAYGWTPVVLRIEDGIHSVARNLTLVRLASGTLETKFTAYPLQEDSSDVVWYDPGTLSSLPQYDGRSAPRAPTFTVHDFMAKWQTATGREVVYSYSDSFGFGVERIDGVGNALSSGEPPWWCYKMDGESADLGISLQPMTPGAVVTWEYGTCA